MNPGDYRLVFPLPRWALVARGRHHPCLAGCILTVTSADQVEVTGPSRELVFDQAQRWLRAISRGRMPEALPAVLFTPRALGRGERGGQDSWTIIVDAGVCFAPTAMPVEVFGGADRATRKSIDAESGEYATA